jgi:hypothetical protein
MMASFSGETRRVLGSVAKVLLQALHWNRCVWNLVFPNLTTSFDCWQWGQEMGIEIMVERLRKNYTRINKKGNITPSHEFLPNENHVF